MTELGNELFQDEHPPKDNLWTHLVLPLAVVSMLAVIVFGGWAALTHHWPFEAPKPLAMTNTEKANVYLQQEGFTAPVAAGIVGNLIFESGVDPTAIQISGHGFGIAMWMDKDKIEQYAADNHRRATDLYLQLDYLIQDMRKPANAAMLTHLQAADNHRDAAIVFALEYLRVSKDYPNLARRVKYAKQELL